MEDRTPEQQPTTVRNAPTFCTPRHELEGPICFITLNRPRADNIVDAAAIRELPAAWETFRADPALKVAFL